MRTAMLSVLAFAAIAIAAPSEMVARDLSSPIAFHALNTTDGRIAVADGAPNGLYTAHNETHAAYHGEVPFGHANYVRSSLEARAFTCDPSCNGEQANSNDIQTAESALASMLGNGLSWHSQIYYLYNTVYAFGCDYGSGQKTTGSDYQASINCVDSNCGSTQSGWDSIHDWKLTFGRVYGSFSCN